MNNFERVIPKRRDVVLWLAALQICFQYVCATLPFSGISIMMAFILISISLIEILRYRIRITSSFLGISLFVILSFTFSMLLLSEISYTINYFERFLLFGLVALLLGNQAEDKEEIIRRVIVIGTVLLPLMMTGSILQMNSSNQMGYAYSCLPVLIASFIGLSYGKNYFILSVINIFALTIKFVSFAPRGVWVIVATAIAFQLFWKLCIGKTKGLRLFSTTFIIIVFLVGVIFMVYNLEYIIVVMNNFLINKFNIRVYALEKYLRYLTQGKLLNGRDYTWGLAMELISKKPLFGHGIGYYENLTGGSYCHNIFLEALCEGGILFAIPITLYIVGMISKIVNSVFEQKIAEYHWNVFSFCVGIIILFFSSSYWVHTIFWFFVGTYMKDSKGCIRWRNKV